MHKITVKDLPGLDLGDIRRNDRLVTIINGITARPGSSIPQQSKSWYDTKAAYNFFSNENISVHMLQDTMMSYGQAQVAGSPQILVVHDISNISYNDSNADGLGYLDSRSGKGIMCYTSMAVSPQGLPLGLLYQHSWIRDPEQVGKSSLRKKLPFEDKESYLWYQGVEEVNNLLKNDTHKIHIADREADIYELFFQHFEPHTDLLIRARHNRRIGPSGHLWDTIAEMPLCGTSVIEVPDKRHNKKKRIKIEIRYRKVELLRPQDTKHAYNSVELTAIEVRLAGKPADGINWKLLTSINIDSISEVLQCIKWYTYRWLIERFHYVLKSGTKIEELQLRQADRLQKAILVYSLAAFIVMQLVYEARFYPELSCEVMLTEAKWKTLFILIHGNRKIPEKPPSLKQAVMWIGRLGGHLGRKSDGHPGLKTIWLGYQQLSAALNVYQSLSKNLGKA